MVAAQSSCEADIHQEGFQASRLPTGEVSGNSGKLASGTNER